MKDVGSSSEKEPQLAPLILHTRRLFSLSSLSLLIDENNIGCLPAITFKNDFFFFLFFFFWLALAAWLIPSELHYERGNWEKARVARQAKAAAAAVV